MLSLTNCVIRPMSMKRTYLPVKYFVQPNKHTFLTAQYGMDKNVLITTTNNNIAKMISIDNNCETIEQPLLVPRAIAEEMGIDIVIILNWYCDAKSRKNCQEIYYICAPIRSASIVRTRLIEYE